MGEALTPNLRESLIWGEGGGRHRIWDLEDFRYFTLSASQTVHSIEEVHISILCRPEASGILWFHFWLNQVMLTRVRYVVLRRKALLYCPLNR